MMYQKWIILLALSFAGVLGAATDVLCLVSGDTKTQGLSDIEPGALAAYQKAGYRLVFGEYQTTTYEELCRYPVVVGMMPQLHNGTRAISDNLAAALDRYMRQGGGFVLIAEPSYYTLDDFARQLNLFLKTYDNELINDIPVDSQPENNLKCTRVLEYRYLKTSALKKHPVTRNIPFIYLPLDFSNNYIRTYTMRPGREWETLITGEDTCLSADSKALREGKVQVGAYAKNPPFLAVRPVGNGYLAVFTTASQYFIADACHWSFGDGLVLFEGNGLQLMDQLFQYVSQHRALMPPAPPVTAAAAVQTAAGNLPVIQEKTEWIDLVQNKLMPPGYGIVYYVNCGSLSDAVYTPRRGYGRSDAADRSWVIRRPWMEIFHPTAASGRACDRGEFAYRFDRLDQNVSYKAMFLVWSTQIEVARELVVSVETAPGQWQTLQQITPPRFDQQQGPLAVTVDIPAQAVSGGSLTLKFSRGAAGAGDVAILNEIWLLAPGGKARAASAVINDFDNPAKGYAVEPVSRKLYRGLIGAHSNYTDGKNSVREMSEAAKKAGLQFLIFTDPLADFPVEKVKAFVSECAASSGDGFTAVPGVLLSASSPKTPDDRIQSYFAGNFTALPRPGEVPEPYDLFWKFFGGEFTGGRAAPGNLREPNLNRVSPYFQRFWRGLDVTSFARNNVRTDTAFALFAELSAAGYAPQPRVSGVYLSSAEITRYANDWQVQILIDGNENPVPFLYSASVSSGPVLERASFSNDVMRDGEIGNGNSFRNSMTVLAELQAAADQKITEVELVKSGRVIRRFYPGQNRIAIAEFVQITGQSSLYWYLKTADGKELITGNYNLSDEKMLSLMCADNQNSICSVTQAPRRFVRDERELYLQHSYWHTGEAVGQLGVMRDAEKLVARVIETGIIQLCKSYRPMPVLFAPGGDEDHLKSVMKIASANGSGNLITYAYDRPESKLKSFLKISSFRPRVNGDTVNFLELEIEVKQNIAAADYRSLQVLSMGLMPNFPDHWQYLTESPGGELRHGDVPPRGQAVDGVLAPCGVAGFYPNDLADLVILSLNAQPLDVRIDRVREWNCRERIALSLPKRDLVKGEIIRLGFVTMLHTGNLRQPEDFLAVKKAYLDQDPVQKVLQGKAQFGYLIDGAAAADALQFVANPIARLPLRVGNLNENWTAALAVGKELKIADQTGGTMLELLDNVAAGTVVTAGNLAVSDDPELVIEYIGRSESGVSLHLHNPQPVARTVEVSLNPAFRNVLDDFKFKLTLQPGSSQWLSAKGGKIKLETTR